MAKTYTVTWVSQDSNDGTGRVEVDDVVLTKGEPVSGLTASQVERLKALSGLAFSVDEDKAGGKSGSSE